MNDEAIEALKIRMADFAYSDLPSAIKQGELDKELEGVGLVRKGEAVTIKTEYKAIIEEQVEDNISKVTPVLITIEKEAGLDEE